MRPHRLQVTAFGAFGGTAEVSFDDLASSGLFLLHGETGAGKTTLLDAIGFALYGRVPGERGKARRLRSDHAAAGTPTEVQLEATIGARRMRITRRPEQERPKRRGSGTTTEQAKILLEEHRDASWRAVSTRAGEADDEIKDLMGMSAEQFYQVVLLPQGQFAQFLHADAADRARLLQRLFGTDRFRSVEEWLAERRRTTAREVEEAELGIKELTARIAQVAGGSGPEAADPEQAMASSRRWAEQLADAAEAEACAQAGQAARYRADLDEALDARRAAEQLADRQRRRADALRARDELAAAEAGVQALRRELGEAARAAEVAPALAEAERTAEALAAAREAEAQARAAAAAHGDAEAAAARLRAAAQEKVAQAGRLEALRSVSRQAAEEQHAAAQARAAAAGLAAQIGAAAEELAASQQQRPGLSRERDQAREAGQELPAARAEADRYRRAADDAAALVSAWADKSRQEQAYIDAKIESAELLAGAAELRMARIDGMRAELAATLVDGAPCPVCGSLDHPELCELRGERVTREQEEAASAAAAAAAERAESIGTRLGAAHERVSDLSARLEEAGFAVATDLASLKAEAARLKNAARAVQAQAAGLAAKAARHRDLQAELEAYDQAIAAAEKRLIELEDQREYELRQAAEADQRSARHRETLLAQLGGLPDLEAALSAAREAAGALTAAADAADAAARARADAVRAADLAAQAAAGAGFAGLDEARDAARDATWRARADEAIREHEASARAAADLLADPDLDVALDPPADITGAAAAVEAARKLHDDAVAGYDRARHRADQLADLVPQLGTRLGELSPLAERAAQARRLADLAAGLGANTLRMTLSSFVLAARLEEVAAAASERLLKMTSGRYSLVHTDARRGAGRSGLGLLACDAWTGVDRDTSTLSGGETFLASLALALGLADVVTAEAGGTRIEALFVDEGFGSLDEETLEEVMTVLDGLREGGRMVGIVSHVPELRQRIPAQVRVHKGHHGSHVTVSSKSLFIRNEPWCSAAGRIGRQGGDDAPWVDASHRLVGRPEPKAPDADRHPVSGNHGRRCHRRGPRPDRKPGRARRRRQPPRRRAARARLRRQHDRARRPGRPDQGGGGDPHRGPVGGQRHR
jgi:DNA repair protein SbcC/Rad50